MAQGTSRAIHYPNAGPYDQRLGYADLPEFLRRLKASGYQVKAQARDSRPYLLLTGLGLYPVYHEKTQAGLQILDRDGKILSAVRFPARIYSDVSEIPPLLVDTVLFIENHNLLDSRHPYRNPAVEWSRLSRALVVYSIHKVDHNTHVIGGSTLATQLEKIRHSPGGKTHSLKEKFWQMASASLRVYQDGPETVAARREILRDYINSIPLAAFPTQGEVTGLGDGLHVWYGADFMAVNHLLEAPERALTAVEQDQKALAYREALSLFLATRAPHYYLVQNPERLAGQTDRYLRALHKAGLISTQLCGLALRAHATVRREVPGQQVADFVTDKAPNLVRVQLHPLLGLNNSYALDHLDLSVLTTIDSQVQQNVTHFLEQLANPANVDKQNLRQYQLLAQGDPSSVIYSFTLYEREPGVNLLRVETDNYNEPLSINQGTRLQLGSTAKLRTLIEYLQIVEQLHDAYSTLAPAQLETTSIQPDDRLTQWACKYLSTTQDKSLMAMFQAALNREYSARPDEGFFTAGGLHHFANFETSDNGRVLTVSDAFQHSVNLVFVRLMRDIERYYVYRTPGATPNVLTDPAAEARQRYLARFADQEGKVFLARFYEQYRGQSPDQAVGTLLHSIHLTPARLSVIYRSVHPEAGLGEFSGFMRSHLPSELFKSQELEGLYTKYDRDNFDLSDRGYLAHIHPLQLWLLNYLRQHPTATLSEILAQSASQRQEVYRWLFRTKYRSAQDLRIKILMEQDAFENIWRDWRQLGYPFDSLVPSYATAIGVSGDTPEALAELMGIIVNDGVRDPTITIRQLQFAQDTPIDTVLARESRQGERVLSPQIAELVREQLIGVVENGTGRRIQGGVILQDGTILPIGGKTGTGDNRFKIFDAAGQLLGSRAVNRTAAFVFMIGDRFYGTVTAFVPGKTSANYNFTSALAVQVLKDLEPQLLPLIERAE
ncbi:MAG: transglycosylase domain-containing protein, partial [Candidatus Sulfotelmatobacter sp.]